MGEIHRRAGAGASIRAMARELDVDRKTVRRCLRQTAWKPYERATRSETLLTAHAEYLRRRASAVDYSAQVLVWRQALLPPNVNYSCRFGRLLLRRRTVRWALLRVLKTQKTKRRERPAWGRSRSAVAKRAASEGRGWWLLRGTEGPSSTGWRGRRRRGGWGGGLGARAAVEREPETGHGGAAAARRVAGRGLA